MKSMKQLKMTFSKNLEKVGNMEIGRQLPKLEGLSLLNIGTTLPIFSFLGTIPVDIDKFIKCVKGAESGNILLLTSVILTWSKPVAFFHP